MMDLNEIEVIIEKDGRVIVSVSGAKGNSCVDMTAELEKVLGGVVETREMKPEAAQTVSLADKDRQKLGF